jgi:hypothetical protein
MAETSTKLPFPKTQAEMTKYSENYYWNKDSGAWYTSKPISEPTYTPEPTSEPKQIEKQIQDTLAKISDIKSQMTTTTSEPTSTPKPTPTPTPEPEQIKQQIQNTIAQISDVKAKIAGEGKTPEEIKKEIELILPQIENLKTQIAEEEGDEFSLEEELGGDIRDESVITDSTSAREIAEGLKEDEEKSSQEDIDDKQQQVQGLTLDKQIQDLKTELGMETQKSAIPTFADDYEALRSEYGIAGIENQINSINKQISDKEATLRQGMYNVEGELKPMELIGTEQRELQRQAYEEIDALNRRKQTLVDELATKQTLISNLMSLKQLDYQTATDAYQQEFSNNINLLNIIENRASAEEQRANQQQDDARANLNTMINMMADGGQTWDNLDNTMKTEIVKLEMKGNLPIGTIESFMNIKPNSKLIATKDGYDEAGNAIVSFIYEDDKGNPGIVKTVKTGGVYSGKTTGLSGEGEDEIALKNRLLKSKGTDGFVDPKIYQEVKSTADISADQFDKKFSYLLSPQERQNLGIEKSNEETDEETDPATALEKMGNVFTKFKEAGFSKKEVEEQFKTDNNLDNIPDVYQKIIDEIYENGKPAKSFWQKLGEMFYSMIKD